MLGCTDLVEHDEYELHDGLARRGVGDGLLDLGEPHVAVTARGAEQLSLEAAAVVGRDNACHVRELHVRVAVGLRKNGHEGQKKEERRNKNKKKDQRNEGRRQRIKKKRL